MTNIEKIIKNKKERYYKLENKITQLNLEYMCILNNEITKLNEKCLKRISSEINYLERQQDILMKQINEKERMMRGI